MLTLPEELLEPDELESVLELLGAFPALETCTPSFKGIYPPDLVSPGYDGVAYDADTLSVEM